MHENDKVALVMGETTQKRIRASTKRSRNGCSTCRIRRIKCDEFKPKCGQCTKGLRRCEGYNPNCLLRPAESFPTSPSISNPLNPLACTNSSELHSFAFFCRHTVPQLCGFFPSTFWTIFVLQTAHHEKAILHAAIALGAFHEQFETKEMGISGDSPNQFAIEQYGKAIKMIFNPICEGNLSTETTLIACVMFICIEIILGHHGTAISHISSGVKLLLDERRKKRHLRDSTMNSSSLTYVPISILSMVFLRLDIQASQILSHRPLYIREEFTNKETCFQPHIPERFNTLEEARNAMDYLRSCVMRSLENITQAEIIFPRSPEDPWISDLQIDRKGCSLRLKKWAIVFETFLGEYGQQLDVVQRQGVQLLKIHMIMTQMNLEIEDLDVKWTETAYDTYALEFKAIISHASAIINSQETSKGSFRFSLDPGVVPALYFVASKCRHPLIRRKALSLLTQVGKQEGVWDSKPVVKVLERFVEIEEEGLGELMDGFDVPDSNRLSGIDATFDLDGRRASVRYQRIWGSGIITKRDLREVVEW